MLTILKDFIDNMYEIENCLDLETLTEREVHLYIGNHKTLVGISDIINLLRDELNRVGSSVVLTKSLAPNGINIIIDEFSIGQRVNTLLDIKSRYPDTRLYLVLTEFETSRASIKNFNQFDGFSHFVIAVYVRGYFKLFQHSAFKLGLMDLFYLIGFAPLLVFIVGKHYTLRLLRQRPDSFRKTYRTPIYMTMRHAGLSIVGSCINAFISLHANIVAPKEATQSQGIKLIYPIISNEDLLPEKLRAKKMGILMSGSLTPFRVQEFENLRSFFLEKIPSALFASKPFDATETPCELLFSFHPPQSKGWKYISPTRIYRSLSIDHSIPVIPSRLGQHPIEDCCMTTEELLGFALSDDNAVEVLIERVITSVHRYNSICSEINRYSLNQILFGDN